MSYLKLANTPKREVTPLQVAEFLNLVNADSRVKKIMKALLIAYCVAIIGSLIMLKDMLQCF